MGTPGPGRFPSGLTFFCGSSCDSSRMRQAAPPNAGISVSSRNPLFLPSYPPNLDLIERLWKFTKRRALYGRYHPTFRDFQAAIGEILDGWSTRYFQQPAWLMTLNFQHFDDLSLMAA